MKLNRLIIPGIFCLLFCIFSCTDDKDSPDGSTESKEFPSAQQYESNIKGYLWGVSSYYCVDSSGKVVSNEIASKVLDSQDFSEYIYKGVYFCEDGIIYFKERGKRGISKLIPMDYDPSDGWFKLGFSSSVAKMRIVSWNMEEIVVEFPPVEYAETGESTEVTSLFPRFKASRLPKSEYAQWVADYLPNNYDPEGYGLK